MSDFYSGEAHQNVSEFFPQKSRTGKRSIKIPAAKMLAAIAGAAGAFIQGASIELSADAPMRPPYTVYMQGGLTYESGKLGILLAAEELLRK